MSEMLRRDEIYTQQAIWKVMIPVTVFGWLTAGVICVLCLNGRCKAGRWVPLWYLESGRTGRDKGLVALWWFAVLLLWPVIMPMLGLRKLGMRIAKRVRQLRWDTVRMLADEKGTTMCSSDGCSDEADGVLPV